MLAKTFDMYSKQNTTLNNKTVTYLTVWVAHKIYLKNEVFQHNLTCCIFSVKIKKDLKNLANINTGKTHHII